MPFWPYVGAVAPCSGRPQPGTARLQREIMEVFDRAIDNGIYNCRASTADSRTMSIHSDGRAADSGFPDPITGLVGSRVTNPHPDGFVLCELLRANATDLGIMGIIWDRRRFDYRTPWGRTYTGPVPHIDHIHWEQHPKLAVELTQSTIDRVFGGTPMAFTSKQEETLKLLADSLTKPGPTTGRVGNGESLVHVLEAYRLVALNAGLSPLDHAGIARLLGQ